MSSVLDIITPPRPKLPAGRPPVKDLVKVAEWNVLKQAQVAWDALYGNKKTTRSKSQKLKEKYEVVFESDIIEDINDTPYNKYLDEHLLPLYESIDSKIDWTSSSKMKGLAGKISEPSMRSQEGCKLEEFFKQLTKDCGAINHIVNNKETLLTTIMNAAGQQIVLNHRLDLLFETERDGCVHNWECKMNYALDSKRKPSEIDAIKNLDASLKVAFPTKTIDSGCFNPTTRKDDCRYSIKNKNTGEKFSLPMRGVETMLNVLNCSFFTIDEYFRYMKTNIARIWKQKLMEG